MKISIVDFYREVTGKDCTISTRTARSALERWGILYDTNTREGAAKQFWKADVKGITDAKAAYTKEVAEAAARAAKAAKPKPNGQGPLLDTRAVDGEGFTLMQRMANVEQELRTIKTTLEDFVKRF